MKPLLEHIAQDEVCSIVAYWREEPSFAFNWHYHPEFELTYIHRGSGTRLVGDHLEDFHDGDLVLLGPNLPHTWATDGSVVGEEHRSAVVVQFKKEALNEHLLTLPEFGGVRRLLEKSRQGMAFPPSTVEAVASRLAVLPTLVGLERFTFLLLILEYLGQCTEHKILASALYNPSVGKDIEQRIDRACRFLHDNFMKPVALSKIASEVHMAETSFCRFFKKMTGKGFSDYLNDLRVHRACQLLTEGESAMPEVAYNAGFGSMTHFNRMFLKKKKMSPSAFRKKISQQKP